MSVCLCGGCILALLFIHRNVLSEVFVSCMESTPGSCVQIQKRGGAFQLCRAGLCFCLSVINTEHEFLSESRMSVLEGSEVVSPFLPYTDWGSGGVRNPGNASVCPVL